MTPRDVTINLLRKWEGRREIGGNNKGWWVSYLTRGRNGAWCAALLFTAIETAYHALGLDCPIKRTHGARRLLKAVAAAGSEVDKLALEPGDIVCFRRGNQDWQGHVAMVVEKTKVPGIYILADGNVGKRAKVRLYQEDLVNRPVVGCARLG